MSEFHKRERNVHDDVKMRLIDAARDRGANFRGAVFKPNHAICRNVAFGQNAIHQIKRMETGLKAPLNKIWRRKTRYS